jgi:hypothetical protein
VVVIGLAVGEGGHQSLAAPAVYERDHVKEIATAELGRVPHSEAVHVRLIRKEANMQNLGIIKLSLYFHRWGPR